MAGNGPGTNASGHYENVACPFCGILCDDLTISADGNRLKVVNNGCVKAVAGFERSVAGSGTSPQISGQAVTLDEAVMEAARLIRASNLPVFGGLGTDVAGMRAVMSAADAAGAVVDHAMSDSMFKNYRVLQSTGWMLSSLTEARNRADVFVVLGTDIQTRHPRFFERIVCADASMFADPPGKRTIIFIGEGLDASVAAATGQRIGDVITLPVKAERIGELLLALRALLKGAPLTSEDIAGLTRPEIDDVLARCRNAKYGVMVWSASSLSFPNADLTVQAASEFIKDLNQSTRFAGLLLGGDEGSASAAAVCTWQSGFPMRVSFASGIPDYDIERYSTAKLIAAKATDLVVWVASFTPDLSPPDCDVPMIVLGTPGLQMNRTPQVFIPVGTPGVDHDGGAVRCDSVITMPLRNLGRSNLPRTADVLAAIEAAL